MKSEKSATAVHDVQLSTRRPLLPRQIVAAIALLGVAALPAAVPAAAQGAQPRPPAAAPAAGTPAADAPAANAAGAPAGAAASTAPKAPTPLDMPTDGPPLDKIDGMDLKTILTKSADARGGLQKIHAVKTRREIGKISLEPGTEWPFTVEHKRDRSLRMEIQLPGSQLIRAYDGLHGWQMQPQSKAAEAVTPDDAHNLFNEADFDNALIDTTIKGHAELLGKEPIDGTTGYRVKVVLLTGDVFYYDIDVKTFLPVHWEGARRINNKLIIFETAFGDYREVAGVKYPFLMISSMKGSNQHQRITFSTIEANPPIDESRFHAPPAPANAPGLGAPAAGAPPPAPGRPAAPATQQPPPAAPTPPPAKPPRGAA